MPICRRAADRSRRRRWVAASSAQKPISSTATGDTTSAAALPLAATDAASAYIPVTLTDYAYAVVGPRALLRDAATAGFDQAIAGFRRDTTNRRPQWPRTWRGYGDRLSSRVGAEAIAQTLIFGLSRGRDERKAKFSLCACGDTASRLRHALLTPLRVNTPHGPDLTMMLPASEMIGAIIVTSFKPEGFSLRLFGESCG